MSIEDVKKKNELKWMKIKGVEGVGITEEHGKKVIVLYISEKTADVAKIPDQIADCPIIKKTSGEFQAY